MEKLELEKKRRLLKSPNDEDITLETLVLDLNSLSHDISTIELFDNKLAARRIIVALYKHDKKIKAYREKIKEIRSTF